LPLKKAFNKIIMSVYLRELNDDIIRLNQNLSVNTFIPDGLLELIESVVPENNYIIGVKYETGDCQVCMSGHPKIGETTKEGCLRELTEELFLNSKDGEIKLHSNKDINYFYSITLRETYITKILNYNRDKDLPHRAVICVHGNEFEVLRYMSKIKKQEKNKDMINGIWAAKKDKIVKLIRRIQKSHKRSRIY